MAWLDAELVGIAFDEKRASELQHIYSFNAYIYIKEGKETAVHSSEILRAQHFEYVLRGQQTGSLCDFSAFCPGYKDTDRLGVVNPCYEDGLLGAAYAILAFTTAFYNGQRSRSNDFFIYPQHFAFFDWNQEGIRTGWNRFSPAAEGVLASWANLDVFPESQWVATDGTVIEVLQLVIARGVNRLLWPARLQWKGESCELPPTLLPWIDKQLGSIYLYGSKEPNVEIYVAQVVEDLVSESIDQLPTITEERKRVLQAERAQRGRVEAYRQVSPQQFLVSNVGASQPQRGDTK